VENGPTPKADNLRNKEESRKNLLMIFPNLCIKIQHTNSLRRLSSSSYYETFWRCTKKTSSHQ